MSLLVMSEPPADAAVFHVSDGPVLVLGEMRMSLEEFRRLVVYVMCNTNIERHDDSRLELLNDIKCLWPIEDQFGKRLAGPRELPKRYSNRT